MIVMLKIYLIIIIRENTNVRGRWRMHGGMGKNWRETITNYTGLTFITLTIILSLFTYNLTVLQTEFDFNICIVQTCDVKYFTSTIMLFVFGTKGEYKITTPFLLFSPLVLWPPSLPKKQRVYNKINGIQNFPWIWIVHVYPYYKSNTVGRIWLIDMLHNWKRQFHLSLCYRTITLYQIYWRDLSQCKN